MTESPTNYAELEEQGLGSFNEDGEWIWTLLPEQIITATEIEAQNEQGQQ